MNSDDFRKRAQTRHDQYQQFKLQQQQDEQRRLAERKASERAWEQQQKEMNRKSAIIQPKIAAQMRADAKIIAPYLSETNNFNQLELARRRLPSSREPGKNICYRPLVLADNTWDGRGSGKWREPKQVIKGSFWLVDSHSTKKDSREHQHYEATVITETFDHHAIYVNREGGLLLAAHYVEKEGSFFPADGLLMSGASEGNSYYRDEYNKRFSERQWWYHTVRWCTDEDLIPLSNTPTKLEDPRVAELIEKWQQKLLALMPQPPQSNMQ
jgi:hypothetical protein